MPPRLMLTRRSGAALRLICLRALLQRRCQFAPRPLILMMLLPHMLSYVAADDYALRCRYACAYTLVYLRHMSSIRLFIAAPRSLYGAPLLMMPQCVYDTCRAQSEKSAAQKHTMINSDALRQH